MNSRIHFATLRRRALIFASLAALAAVPSAAAGLHSIRRDFGELSVPRLRAGTLVVPPAHRDHRIRVIVTLNLPPLAQAYGRGLFSTGSTRQLNVHTASSRAYLARINEAQQARRRAVEARDSLGGRLAAVPRRPGRVHRLAAREEAPVARAPELRRARLAELHVSPLAQPKPEHHRRRRASTRQPAPTARA